MANTFSLERVLTDFAAERDIPLNTNSDARSLVVGPSRIIRIASLLNPTPDDRRTYDSALTGSAGGFELTYLRSKFPESNTQEILNIFGQRMHVTITLTEGDLTGEITVLNAKLATAVHYMRRTDKSLASRDSFEHKYGFSAETAYDSVSQFLTALFEN